MTLLLNERGDSIKHAQQSPIEIYGLSALGILLLGGSHLNRVEYESKSFSLGVKSLSSGKPVFRFIRMVLGLLKLLWSALGAELLLAVCLVSVFVLAAEKKFMERSIMIL